VLHQPFYVLLPLFSLFFTPILSISEDVDERCDGDGSFASKTPASFPLPHEYCIVPFPLLKKLRTKLAFPLFWPRVPSEGRSPRTVTDSSAKPYSYPFFFFFPPSVHENVFLHLQSRSSLHSFPGILSRSLLFHNLVYSVQNPSSLFFLRLHATTPV